MFPPDDSNAVDAAAETAFGAASSLMHSPLVEKQLNSEYGDQNVAFVDGVERFKDQALEGESFARFQCDFQRIEQIGNL